MNFFGRHKFVLLFLALLVFSSVMVILQMDWKRSQHVESREAFILLHTRGYTNEAVALYNRLLRELPALPRKELLEDFQRTMMLVDPRDRKSVV